MPPPITARGQRRVFGLKQKISKHINRKHMLDKGMRLDLATGSQQNIESVGRRAVARVATYSHQLIRQRRLEPRVLKVGLLKFQHIWLRY